MAPVIKQLFIVLGSVALLAMNTSCTWGSSNKKSHKTVHIDGSSTVFPIAEITAEHFGQEHKDVRVTVGVSGTGGGFNKFANNQIDIANASRLIKDKEAAKAKKNDVNYEKFDVAFDGISVIVHKENKFAKELTFAQLKSLWEAGSKVKTWKNLNPSWPDEKINLYGPSPENGTFDFFKEAVVGKKGSVRSDYTATEDDNVIVSGVSGDKNSLGYFGYAYYLENKDKLGVLALKKNDTDKALLPNIETIKDNSYPLSRPIYVYVNTKSLTKDEVSNYLTYMLEQAHTFVPKVGYIGLGEKAYDASLKRLAALTKSNRKKYATK